MNIDKFRNYCLSKTASTEDFPFDETTLCFRVIDKIFAITDIEALPFSFNLKCNPEKALELREKYESIEPGFHMNKKHWNTITPDNFIDDILIYDLIDHSYNLVVEGLKKSDREKLQNL